MANPFESLRYVTDESGHKTAVQLSIPDYERLIEDMEDLVAIADRVKEPTVSHEYFLRDLKRDGLLPS